MASMSSSGPSFDMAAWDLSDLASGTSSLDSATEVDIAGAAFTYTITGTGFTTFDAHGFPTSGTVTGFTQDAPGHSPLVITGISLSAADFMTFVQNNDAAGLEAAMFSGDDSFTGRSGNDVLLGFGGDDTFNLTHAGKDTVQGGDGDDVVRFGATFTAADSVDGGDDTDEIVLRGDYSAGVTLGAATMVNVETLRLGQGFDYNLTLNATSDTAGEALTINAFSLGKNDHAILDVSQLAGSVKALGGHGDDIVNFGGNFDSHDSFNGSTGNDTMVLDGNYAHHLRIFASQIPHVETLQLTAGHDYNIKLSAPVATIDASTLGSGDTLTLKLTPEFQIVKITGGAGNDTIDAEGDSGVTTIDLSKGGDDTVYVNGTNLDAHSAGAVLDYGAAYTSADQIFAINNNHVSGNLVWVELDGDYSAGVSFDSTNMAAIDQINLAGGHNYNLAFDGTLSHEILVLATLTASDTLTFDGSAQTSGSVEIAPTAGTFHITGGGGQTILLVNGTASGSLTGGTGITDVTWGAGFNSGDSLDGGTGHQNALTLTGDYSGGLTFTAGMMQNFQIMFLQPTLSTVHDTITLADGNIAAGSGLQISGSKFLTINDQAETDGRLFASIDGGTVNAGAGNDVLTGAKHTDTFSGGGGSDLIFCGSGTDTLVYNAVSDSTGAGYDTVANFNASVDFFNMPGAVSGIDAKVASGTLSTATFDADLAAAIGSGQLAAHHAVLFTANAGTLSGDTFLIVDANNTAGYQAGADYVIELTTPTNLSALSTADFI